MEPFGEENNMRKNKKYNVMKKKGNALLVLMALLLTACGGETGSKTANSDEIMTEATAEQTTEANSEPTAEPTPEPTTEPTPEPTPEPTAEPIVEAATEWTEYTFEATEYCAGVENVKMFVTEPMMFSSFKVRFENLPTEKKLNLYLDIIGSTKDGYFFSYTCGDGDPVYFDLYTADGMVEFSSAKKNEWGSYEDESFGSVIIEEGKEYNAGEIFMDRFTTEAFDLSAHEIDWPSVSVTIGFSIENMLFAEEGSGQGYTWSFGE